MKVNINDLISKNGMLYLKSEDNLFEGNIVGKLNVKVVKGLLEGECKTYYDSGELKEKYNYLSSYRGEKIKTILVVFY